MNGARLGTVLANYGRGVLVQTDAGAVHCALKGRKQRPVCGDRVAFSMEPSAEAGMVESVEPRRNLIERIDARGRPEPVAANVDRVAIVAAPEPAPDWFLVDRYWAGARLAHVPAVLVVNKTDLGAEPLAAEIANYRRLSLRCVEVAARSGDGLEALRAALAGGATLLVGQSGVGKSSLVNALVPHAQAQTAELTRDDEGRHTTTTARRYALSEASALIDAPGVRDFAPPAAATRAAEQGFSEIDALAGRCRFNDCRHYEEPGCAVRAAVAAGEIAPRRYESYRRLLRLYERLAEPG